MADLKRTKSNVTELQDLSLPVSRASNRTEQSQTLMLENTHTLPLPPQPQPPIPQYNTGLRLFMLCISLYLPTFCLAMDKTMLAPALGHITKEFGTVKDVGWYTSAGLLGTAVVQPLCGAIYKFFDSKWVYAISLVLFEIGSLVAAIAPTSAILIVGRAICGLGGAGVTTGNFVILAKSVPLNKIPKYMGFSGAIWATATVAGPLLGGLFAEKLSWRWCFYINLPVGAIAFIMLIIVFPSGNFQDVSESFLSRVLRLDVAGFAAFIPTILMLLLALQWGGSEYSWSSPVIIGMFVGAGVMAGIFGLIERSRGEKGLVPPQFFTTRDVLCCFLFSFFFGAAYFTMFPYLSLYFQAVRGDSSVTTGLKMLPMSLTAVFSSILSGIGISRTGNYNVFMLVQTAVVSIGAGLITTFSRTTPITHWLPFEVIFGLGVGVCFQSTQIVVQNVVPFVMVPQAASNVSFFQTLGGAISVAVAQSVFQNGIISEMEKAVPSVSATLVIDTGASSLQATLKAMGLTTSIIEAVLDVYMAGLKNAFYVSAICAILVFLAATGISWKKIQKRGPPNPSGPSAALNPPSTQPHASKPAISA